MIRAFAAILAVSALIVASSPVCDSDDSLPGREALAELYFGVAGDDSGALDNAAKWLHLLAASSLDAAHGDVLYNVVENYAQNNAIYLAIDVLETAKTHPDIVRRIYAEKLQAEIRHRFPAQSEAYDVEVERLKKVFSGSTAATKDTETHVLFPTHVRRSKNIATSREIDDFYERVVGVYDSFESTTSDVSITNHEFFTWQAEYVRDHDGAHLPAFASSDLMRKLVDETKREAYAMLQESYGFGAAEALRAAAHDLIYWVSVHGPGSVHQPHLTEDAILNAVFYVSTPKNSGKLRFFDPRGKGHLDLKFTGNDAVAEPPFVSYFDVLPEKGTLLMFPGWLVHTVLPSGDSGELDPRHRVSISLSLKGEWKDTSMKVRDRVSEVTR